MYCNVFALVLTAAPGIAMGNANSAELPRHSAVPGGIAVVPLDGIDANTRPVVYFDDKRVMVVNSSGRWSAVVGIPLDAEPGELALRVTQPAAGTVSFKIQPKAYETQRLKIKDKRMVEPTAEDLKRIDKEAKTIMTAFSRYTEDIAATFDFKPPVQGILSSPFGLRRFFNDQPRKPHSGLDFAAPTGAPIVAPAPGRVVAVGNYFFNGNNIIVDHGQGLISMYSHLTRIHVKEGQTVAQGAKLGTVGATGRVTGPHLHWTVSLNNVRVDPMLLFGDETLARITNRSDTRDHDKGSSGTE